MARFKGDGFSCQERGPEGTEGTEGTEGSGGMGRDGEGWGGMGRDGEGWGGMGRDGVGKSELGKICQDLAHVAQAFARLERPNDLFADAARLQLGKVDVPNNGARFWIFSSTQRAPRTGTFVFCFGLLPWCPTGPAISALTDLSRLFACLASLDCHSSSWLIDSS